MNNRLPSPSRSRRGFTLAELALTLLALSALVGVTIAGLSDTSEQVKDRTIEQALVQLAGDATRQASYGGENLSVELFEQALALPTSSELFRTIADGTDTPSEGYWDVSVLVSPDGGEAFLAVRGFTGDRCIVGSVSRNGTVRVSRAQELATVGSERADCSPDTAFVLNGDESLAPPSWREGFVPEGVAGPEQVLVGWNTADVIVPAGDGVPQVTSVTAFAQRTFGGTLSSCSVPYAPESVTTSTLGTEFACPIVGLQAGVVYNIWLVSVNSDGVQSSASPMLQLTPTALPDGEVTVDGSSDGITITWSFDPDAGGVAPASASMGTSGAVVQVQTTSSGAFRVTRYRIDPANGLVLSSDVFPLIPYDPFRAEYSLFNGASAGSPFPVAQGAFYQYEVELVSSSFPAVQLESRPVAALRQPQVKPFADSGAEVSKKMTRTVGGRQHQAMLLMWEPVTSAQSYVIEFERKAGQGVSAVSETLIVPADAGAGLAGCPASLRCAEQPVGTLGRGRFQAKVTASSAPPSGELMGRGGRMFTVGSMRDLSDVAESEEQELEEQPAVPRLTVTVVGNQARLSVAQLDASPTARYRLERDGVRVTGPCASLGASGRSSCADTQAPGGRELSYRLVVENDVFSSESPAATVTLLGPLTVSTSGQTRNNLTVSWSSAGAAEYAVYACAASAANRNGDCPTGERGATKLASTALTGTTFARSGAGLTGASYNVANSLTIWSLGCDSTNHSTCPHTRFTVVATNTSGAVLESSSSFVRALGPTPPPPSSPSPPPPPPTSDVVPSAGDTASCPRGFTARQTHLGVRCDPPPAPAPQTSTNDFCERNPGVCYAEPPPPPPPDRNPFAGVPACRSDQVFALTDWGWSCSSPPPPPPPPPVSQLRAIDLYKKAPWSPPPKCSWWNKIRGRC